MTFSKERSLSGRLCDECGQLFLPEKKGSQNRTCKPCKEILHDQIMKEIAKIEIMERENKKQKQKQKPKKRDWKK